MSRRRVVRPAHVRRPHQPRWLLLVVGVGALLVALLSAVSGPPLNPVEQAASLASAPCLSGGAAAPLRDLGLQGAGGAGRDTSARPGLRTQVERALDQGASIVSTAVSWRSLEADPALPPDWSALDRTIEVARAAGLRVRVQLVGMPPWAVTGAPVDGQWRPPLAEEELAAWTGFVSDLMLHVRGRVDYVEVWNEPNAATYWSSGPDPRAYAALLQATYPVVKRIDPDVVVVTGGLRRNDLAFLEGLYQALDASPGLRRPFDMVGLHPSDHAPLSWDGTPVWPYDRQPFTVDDRNVADLRWVHQLMRRHGDGDKPLYVGELADPGDASPLASLAARWADHGCAPYLFALSASPRPAVVPRPRTARPPQRPA